MRTGDRIPQIEDADFLHVTVYEGLVKIMAGDMRSGLKAGFILSGERAGELAQLLADAKVCAASAARVGIQSIQAQSVAHSEIHDDSMWIDFSNIQPGKKFLVFDANGLEWHCVTHCNVVTGEIHYYDNDDGILMLDNRKPIKLQEKTAAPLRIVAVDATQS